ncbi:hypothetical protein RJ639_018286 [Escallonia herrerae]|uniref:non-specific serine/threonine protein kinase n=1 Tax=Escallonia herrerae TaxID=1293975 RepID=A0AA88VAB4_9ASTE|nr:hypothetical protein RJ639_018286 [Escallonia herrerae]
MNVDGAGHQRVQTLDLRQLKVISALGRGAKGVVFLVQTESSGDSLLALKAILKARIEKSKASDHSSDGSEYRRICFEQEVLQCFQHPLFPKLRGILSTEKIIGYAIDYCPGRDLNSLRKKQTEKMFSDDIIRFYGAEMVLALEYLHSLGIVYRDLKPENIMIQENGHLMLVDFDLSTKLSPKTPEIRARRVKPATKPEPVKRKRFGPFVRFCNSGISPEESAHPEDLEVNSLSAESDSASKSNSFVGTEEYVAPEIVLGNGHDFSVDWWCLGIVLYEMLYGATPFRGENRKETFYRVLTKKAELVGEPTPLRNLIGKLLEKDPMQRITAEEIKGHDFFRGVDWDLIMEIPRPPFIPDGPAVEDTKGNNEIDVEAFVQDIFKVGNNEKVDADRELKNSKNNEGVPNNGMWVEGLNHPAQTEDFFIF